MISIENLYECYKMHPVISTDTRTISAGCLFFALKGTRFNGNEFAIRALEKGAAYAIVDEEAYATNDRCLLFPDALKALQELAAYHRQQLTIPIIGITGSNGKTTTKELMHAVLNSHYKACTTKGNLNNHIGVPLTLLAIDRSCEIAVVEMGANCLGEIAELCRIADPDHGIITNIGKAHVEGFGSYEGVIRTKKELYDHLRKKDGKAIINTGNDLLAGMAWELDLISYGIETDASVKGRVRTLTPFLAFEWETDGHEISEVQSNMIGAYNLENLLAAITTGLYFGIPAEKINAAIAAYVPENNRSQMKRTANNTLIMDAYNANPTSMEAAICNFHSIEAERKFFLLGDMLELGRESKPEHQRMVDLLVSLHLEGILVGREFKAIKTLFPTYNTTEEALEYLRDHPLKDALILIKGSRGIQLEKAVPFL